MRILGLDVGEKRIGIARADSNTRIAVPVGTVAVDGSEWQEIARIARVQGAQCFVIGLPRSNEGNETAQSVYARHFAKTLMSNIPEAKVRFQDESLTSVIAEERLAKKRAKQGKKFNKGEIDTEAATIILQDFLESLGSEAARGGAREVAAKKAAVAEPKKKVETGVGAKKVAEIGANFAKMTKKESERAKLTTKKVKHKMKATKVLTGVAILVILGLLGTGGFLMYRDKVRADREEEYRRQEAAMAAEVFSFTIKPGETIFDVKKNLMAEGYAETEVDAALNADYDFQFLKERPEGVGLEGYLYGETHEFYKSASAKEVIFKFLEGMEQVIVRNNLREAYEAQGLTLHEGVTLASVVQKEAKAGDQAGVARVFLNRLAVGMTLGSDVTVSYALDILDPSRETYVDNEAALGVDSCYNTRVYGGLPCGPISNPGFSALKAVAEPTESDYLFFLTGDDGLMYYSSTEAGHIQNRDDHCLELCNVSL